MSLDTLETIRTRRVSRHFKSDPVPEEHLWTILEAARWAPAASNLRLHRYICLTDHEIIHQIIKLSPGIAGTNPAALIVVCVDRNLSSFESLEQSYYEYIDAGRRLKTCY